MTIDDLVAKLARMNDEKADLKVILETAVNGLHETNPRFDWTGIYELFPDNVLRLGHFVGAPTDHVFIGVGDWPRVRQASAPINTGRAAGATSCTGPPALAARGEVANAVFVIIYEVAACASLLSDDRRELFVTIKRRSWEWLTDPVCLFGHWELERWC